MANVLLTGGRAPATLHLLRLLHQAGHKVFQADSLPFPLAGASRYCAASCRLPPPAFEPEAFAAVLGQWMEEKAIDLLIPTCEEVFYVAQYRHLLPAVVFAPPMEVLRQLHSKWQFNQWLLERGLPAVESQLAIFSEVTPSDPPFYPAILKAEYTRFGTAVHLIREEADWAKCKARVAFKGRWVWQRYLNGAHWGTYSVAQVGRLCAHVAYPLQWRYGAQGAATFFESVDCPDIERQVSEMVAALGYTGQIAFDFIRSAADGRFYAIECNPRLTSGAHLFGPKDALANAFWGQSPLVRPSGPPVRLGVPMWLAAERHIFQAAFWRDWQRSQEAVWQSRDPWPSVCQLPLMGYWGQLALRKGLGMTEATTWGIAWDGVV